ncbi:MAG: hypothetical protein KO202_07195 [Methanobacteriaceae archaeon]|nr:hypothetical protein [Methanobacteriaceae archaeon]
MGFDNWGTGKKIAVVLIIIVAIIAIIGAITIITIAPEVSNNLVQVNVSTDGNSSSSNVTGSTANIEPGEYKVQVETSNNWASYITTDGKYSQSSGTGNSEIDLGTVNTYSSITINQEGSGNLKIKIIDSKGNSIYEDNTSADYGSLFVELNAK